MHQDFSRAIDLPTNGIFGLLIALWSTVFVESWKRTETRITYLWNCTDQHFDSKDERDEEFLFFKYFNFKTRKIEKLKKTIDCSKDICLKISSFLGLLGCVTSVVVFRWATIELKFNDDGSLKVLTTDEKIQGYGYTCIYTVAIILFGSAYKMLSMEHTKGENHRYQKQFDDSLVGRLFWANFFNFYLPFFVMAFEDHKYKSFNEMWYLLLTTLAIKQSLNNIVEANLPKLTVDSKIKSLNEKFRPIILRYRPDQIKKIKLTNKAITDLEARTTHTMREYQAVSNYLKM